MIFCELHLQYFSSLPHFLQNFLSAYTKSVYNTISRWQTRESVHPFFGVGKYSITEYEKVKRITFPLDAHAILIVGIEVKVEHDIIIHKILQLINEKPSN